MSVEKLNLRIYGETIPYTQVSTKVIQEIDDLEAGFVWIYLLTLPTTWKVIKQHLKSKFDIGDDKIKKIFSYLSAHNLIEYVRIRDSNGRLSLVDIRVLNGSKFSKNGEITTGGIFTPVEHDAPHLRKSEKIDAPIYDSEINDITKTVTTGVKNHPVVNHTCGKPGTIKNIKNINNIHTKTKHSCAFSNALNSFNVFWFEYPKKVDKKKALRIWKRKALEKSFNEIMDDIQKRKSGEWLKTEIQFIANPSTYLNNERWKDETVSQVAVKKPNTNTCAGFLDFLGEQMYAN